MENDYIFSGIYSLKYEHNYKKLITDLSKHIPVDNIQYFNIDQSVFDNHKDYGNKKCVWCGNKVCKFVFHHGETIKIKKQIEIYKRYIDTNKIIVYTDCDITIRNNIVSQLDRLRQRDDFSKYDIYYNLESNKKRWKAGINIGLNLSYSTDRIINLYQNILDAMENDVYPNNWDQMVVNRFFYQKKTDVTFRCLPNNYLFQHKFARGGG